jgi:hypothetical protein
MKIEFTERTLIPVIRAVELAVRSSEKHLNKCRNFASLIFADL